MINLDTLLIGKKTVGISGHVRPDGDCVGSTLAVYNYIRTYYPEIETDIYLEPIPNTLKFMKHSECICSSVEEDKSHDIFFVLDCGDIGRLGENVKYFHSAKYTICIDHHVSNVEYANENYIIPDASSTCELVFNIMDTDKITKEIAECLYTGIVHDTGVFQYSCTTASTMTAAGILMEKGIDYSKIVHKSYYEKLYKQNLILGKILLDSQLYLDGKCIISYVTKETMEQFDCLPKHLEGVVNQLRLTKDTIVAAFLYETEKNLYRVSLRANEDVNMAEIAMQFQGGGHVRAAGCTMEGEIKDIIVRLAEAISDKIQEWEQNV
ncbi:MAG: bifunctional oligoribonuclease/PAP phosphatase NrnA [Lachnospiraceae bacterium]|nr:bifunctional oligoribonuclease/PAP phosphatase NrnA [Lachnospiraceae bacterium]